MYTVTKFYKQVEVYNYKQGLTGKNAQALTLDLSFTNTSLTKLLIEIAEYFNQTKEALLEAVSDADERGDNFVTFSTVENSQGYFASEKELKLWRNNKCTLYAADYFFVVKRTEELSILDILSELQESDNEC